MIMDGNRFRNNWNIDILDIYLLMHILGGFICVAFYIITWSYYIQLYVKEPTEKLFLLSFNNLKAESILLDPCL